MAYRLSPRLTRRAVDPPAGLVPLQIGRLSDAMRIAHAKMMEGDLQALDRVIKIVGELDRYHCVGGAQTTTAPAGEEREAEIFRPASC